MSLKAKIEAVIYAAEEPVTLAQLVGLLGEEAQAELDRADAAQGSLSLDEDGKDETPETRDGQVDILNEAEEDLEERDPSDQQPAPSDQPEAPADTAEAQTPPEPEAPEPDLTTEDHPQGAQEAEQATADSTAQPADTAASAKAERLRMARLRQFFRSVLDSLIAEYARDDRGLEIREIAGGFRFATKPEYHDAVRGFVRSLKPPLKLSLQALETLAVIAYKQPITAPEISEIRGVDSGGVLGSLMARKLVVTAGRKQVIGRPILYKTTREFLMKFGLKDINELPSIEEFERLAGQMAEQEEIPMPDAADPRPDVDPALEHSAEKLEPERNVHSPQADGDSAPADNLEDAPENKASLDGRMPSLPPDYHAAEMADDPSAQEAEIQSEQNS